MSAGKLEAVREHTEEVASESLIAWMLTTGKKLGLMNLVVLVVFVGGISFVTLRAQSSFAAETKTILDAGIKQEIEDRQKLQNAFDEHLKDDREFKREVLRRIDEGAADSRALYKTVLTGERQYRLERPPAPADGGP